MANEPAGEQRRWSLYDPSDWFWETDLPQGESDSVRAPVALRAMKLVDVIGLHIETTSGAPLVLLREQDEPHRVLPIFVGGQEAASIALALSGESPPRPLTHDLMAALMASVDAHVEAVEVTEVRDGAFLAELTITGPAGGTRLDTRPSDAIALALRVGAPLFVSDDVLEEAGTVVTEEPDEEAIEEEVAEFRSLLDELEPADIMGAIAELPPASAEAGVEDGDPGPDEGPELDDLGD